MLTFVDVKFTAIEERIFYYVGLVYCVLLMCEWICHPPETFKEQIYICLLEILNATLQLLKLN